MKDTKQAWERNALWAKPCPFCGSKSQVTESKDAFDSSTEKACTYIKCLGCGVQVYGDPIRDGDGDFNTDYNTAQHQALNNWNRRAS